MLARMWKKENPPICTPMFTAAWFTFVKTWKQPKCPSIDG